MPNRTPKRALAAAALAVGAFFVSAALGWLRPVTDPFVRAALTVAAPVYRVSAAIGDAARGAEPAPTEMDRLRTENAGLHSLIAENQALKDALGYKEHDSEAMVAARAVARTSGDLFHGIVIDRGSADGIRAGQPVIVGNGIIVGKIESVSSQAATVMLLTDSRSRLAVSLQGASDTLGVLEGDRGSSLSVGLIPQNETVSPGDTVVTSGLEPGIRRGLVVGTVDKVSRGAQDPFQTASVVPLEAAERPLFVEVLGSPETR